MKSSVSQERMDWGSTETLLELVPDKASLDGCEQAPQQGFTGAFCNALDLLLCKTSKFAV